MPLPEFPALDPIAYWRRTPAVTGRPATGADVAAGAALFVASPGVAEALPMHLPARALLRLRGSRVPVVVIQAEAIRGRKGVMRTAGVRYLRGGGITCLISDLDFIGASPGWLWALLSMVERARPPRRKGTGD